MDFEVEPLPDTRVAKKRGRPKKEMMLLKSVKQM